MAARGSLAREKTCLGARHRDMPAKGLAGPEAAWYLDVGVRGA